MYSKLEAVLVIQCFWRQSIARRTLNHLRKLELKGNWIPHFIKKSDKKMNMKPEKANTYIYYVHSVSGRRCVS